MKRMTPSKRQTLQRLGGLGLLLGSGTILALRANAQTTERVINITAKKFEYVPHTITVKQNEPVILEFKSLDFVHGFNLPGYGLRADLTPGKAVRVKLMPNQVGSFPFSCDNFCGDGHEEMSGVLVVEAA